MRESVLALFMSRVTRPVGDNGCWLWDGHLSPKGYGVLVVGGRAGKAVKAHRLAFEHWKGPIPAGLEIDHTCSNRACVNPAHLEAVTHQDNIRRMVARGRGHWVNRTACKRGHEYVAGSYFMHRGARVCRVCEAIHRRATKANRRVAS